LPGFAFRISANVVHSADAECACSTDQNGHHRSKTDDRLSTPTELQAWDGDTATDVAYSGSQFDFE
jgi:hypothetical protein